MNLTDFFKMKGDKNISSDSKKNETAFINKTCIKNNNIPTEIHPGANVISNDNLTPGMRQYVQIKNEHPDCLVLFRMGDFYETFYEDAKTAARELDIVLTARGSGEKRAPLAGIPYHSLEQYLGKLIKKGYKVAIVEQLEDPKKAKGLVKRGLVRIITPGTIIEGSILDDKSNNYIMSIYQNGDDFSVSACDISTGEFFTAKADKDGIMHQIARLNPSECIIPSSLAVNNELTEQLKQNKVFVNQYADEFFRKERAQNVLLEHFKITSLDGFGVNDLLINSSGALLSYLLETQKNDLSHINKIKVANISETMVLDASTIRNLELVRNIIDGSAKGTLLSVIDRTKTAMGSRLIRKWLKEPLINVNEIRKRLDSVEHLVKNSSIRKDVTEVISNINDIERLMGRINYGTANARDLTGLKKSLQSVPLLKAKLENSKGLLSCEMIDVSSIVKLIDETIIEDAPATIREGGIIKPEANKTLKELYDIKLNGKEYIKNLEEKEKTKTGIKTLRVGFNNVFGYFFEISKSYIAQVPSSYIRKQTTANTERYITEELKEQESKILGAEERINELEYEIFVSVMKKTAEHTIEIQKIAQQIAVIDVLTSFATIAVESNYCRPIIDESMRLILKNSRHPVLEQIEWHFVPNNIELVDHEMMVITGPNMAGKSTFMRQVALCVLLSQIGSFVPAEKAEIGVIDRIFTRVGASDDLSTGRSTFMVEMNETANILNNATAKSLIILDEIGRGTSTYDGMSIAWAVAEYIATKVKAKSLFATHYHLLNELSESFSNIKNYNIAVKEDGHDIIFLRKIIEGATDKSYGVHVARLAGLPKEVIERALEIQGKLQKTG